MRYIKNIFLLRSILVFILILFLKGLNRDFFWVEIKPRGVQYINFVEKTALPLLMVALNGCKTSNLK